MRAIQFQNKRVGSTFLQKAIDSHDDIMGIDEVFVNVARKPGMRKSGFVPFVRSDANTPQGYITDILYKTYPDKHTIFKLMYNQIDYHGGLRKFIVDNKVPMIHLRRKNLVKQVISGHTAATTKHNPIALNSFQLMGQVREAEKLANDFANIFKEHIKLELWYEDIIGLTVEDKTYVSDEANTAICKFFGVEEKRLYAKTKKKNKEDIGVYLPNLDEVKEHFKGSKYEWMVA